MKIPLPSGNFIYIGKQNQEIQLYKKSADLVRDDQGNVNGTVPSYSLENVEKYVDIVFSPNSYIKNFVFLFENIAEIQFPIKYLTSRIKSAVGSQRTADELSWKGRGAFFTNTTLLRSGFRGTSNVEHRTSNIFFICKSANFILSLPFNSLE